MAITSDKRLRESEDYKTIINVIKKFEAIEEKNKCLRVKFLDWLSAKLDAGSKAAKEMSTRIDSPCTIKLK